MQHRIHATASTFISSLRAFLLLALVVSADGLKAQYVNATVGPPIRFNDLSYGKSGQPDLGVWELGDTHSCAWMENGDELCTYNDGTQPASVNGGDPVLSNIGLDRMTGGDYHTLASANLMIDYGRASQTNYPSGWTDDRTWKTSGIAPYNGCVYLTVQRQEDYDTLPGGGVGSTVNNGVRNGSSSIVKSCDHGSTWVNFWNTVPSPGGNPPPGNHQMWRVGVRWYSNTNYSAGDYVLDTNGHNQVAKSSGISGSSGPLWNTAGGGTTSDGSITWTDAGPAIAGFVPVTYCQDNTKSCPYIGADGFTSGSYIYLTAMGAGDTDHGSYTNYYLARVLKTAFPSLDVSKYQYWTGSPGGSMLSSGNWGNSMVGALPIINVTGMRSQVYYLSGISSYILIHDGAKGAFEFWIASTLTGPWTKSAVTYAEQNFAEFPTINMSSLTDNGTIPESVTFRMEYGGCSASSPNSYPLEEDYSSHWKYITLTSAPTPAVTATAASHSDNLDRNGLVADLSFLPELGNSITDYSATGHNATAFQDATPYVASSYTNHGLWFNADNPGNNSITGSYTVTVPVQLTGEFTLFVAYRKLQGSKNRECIVSGSQISICRNGTDSDSWIISVNGATTYRNDSANYNGGYYSTGYDGSWNMFIIRYDGLNVYTDNNYSAFAGPHPIAVLHAGISGSPFVLGGNGFSGEIAKFALYSRYLEPSDLLNAANAIFQELDARGAYLSRPPSSGQKLLDSQGVPRGVWSVRRLLSSYTGAAMRLYDVASSTYKDIPFDFNGDLDSSQIANFCTGSNCALNRWYDQSGNGNDLTPDAYSGNAVIGTCGSKGRYCIKTNGYQQLSTGSGFFFYSFTGSVDAVMQVDQSGSGTFETYASLLDGVTPSDQTPALWAALQGGASNNSQLTWARNYNSAAGPKIGNNSLFTVFSWGDSYYNRFVLDGAWLTNTQTVAAPSDAQGRFHAYGFQLGLIGRPLGTPGAAAGYSEVMLWDTALSGGNVGAIGKSQSAYFGTANVW